LLVQQIQAMGVQAKAYQTNAADYAATEAFINSV
jgi:3-oxoacyl-[acyl-carrier protein] reductase